MKLKFTCLLLAAALLALPNLVPAQAHYPAGAEGIKGASLPPPGVYFRDYNFFYWADKFDGGPPGFDHVFAYVNAPRLIWMTEKKILGASYGMDIILPFAYQSIAGSAVNDDRTTFGDIQLEPLLLSWHLEKFDIAGGYAVWVPTGDDDFPASLGKGYWTHMLTLGATWYPDKEKTWAISALNRYEINMEQENTGITSGNEYTLEVGASKTISKGIDVGVVGYFQWQTTKDSGSGASDAQDQVLGVGPEISMLCPKLGVIASLRYYREFLAHNRPEGNTVTLTLTKRF